MRASKTRQECFINKHSRGYIIVINTRVVETIVEKPIDVPLHVREYVDRYL